MVSGVKNINANSVHIFEDTSFSSTGNAAFVVFADLLFSPPVRVARAQLHETYIIKSVKALTRQYFKHSPSEGLS